MSEPWVDKYKPKKLADLEGQSPATQQMKMWAQEWERGRPAKKVLLVYGATGTGKSAAASALAREFCWDILEMNASDKRTLGEINRVAGTAATSGTLLGGKTRRLVVVDEADNIHGTSDRGGYRALKELVEKTRNPLILIANDHSSIPWDIRVACMFIGFGRPSKEAIVSVMCKISQKEGIDADAGALELIARESNGDVRSAIQDLQAVGFGRKKLTEKDVKLHRRDRGKDITDMINGILKLRTVKESRELPWSVGMPPEDALAWVAENIPRMVADSESLAAVYDSISRADIFLGRARQRQAYGLWSYANDLMSAGVAVRKGVDIRFVKTQQPSHIRRYSRTMGTRALRDSISKKLARHCHTSAKVVRRDFMPYFALFKIDRGLIETLTETLELTEPEVNFLKSQ
jgi:replication factor C large subunit